jgi:hypothetical protein
MPDTKFKYPFAAFKGVRIILKSNPKHARQQSLNRLNSIVKQWKYGESTEPHILLTSPTHASNTSMSIVTKGDATSSTFEIENGKTEEDDDEVIVTKSVSLVNILMGLKGKFSNSAKASVDTALEADDSAEKI